MQRRKPRRRNWGAGTITKSGKRWGVRFYVNGRRRHKTYATRELAEQVLAKIVSETAVDDAGLNRDYSKSPNLEALAAAWLERRKMTHRSARDDRCRWKLHLGPAFGRMRPHEVDAAKLRRFIENKLAAGLNPTTVGHCIRLFSTLLTDLREQGYVGSNPVATLTRATRRLYRSNYDVASTPFLSRQEDIERLYRALPEPHSVIFAVGVLAGLRVGEILGLDWADVDLEGRRIRIHQQAQNGRLTCVKDDEARLAPISTSLAPVLAQWRLATGGVGPLFTPTHPTRGGRPDIGRPAQFVRPCTVHKALAKALADCELPKLTLYQATRHSFASQWVMNGGSLELLAKILGHSSTSTTEHYAHLAPDFFGANAHDMVRADLSKPSGTVVHLAHSGGTLGQRIGRKPEFTEEGSQSKSA
jgi:integrase